MVVRLIPGPIPKDPHHYAQSPSWTTPSALTKSHQAVTSPWSMSSVAGRSNDSERHQDKKSSNMRVVIVGTGGIARWIAHYIHQDTGHQLLWLSRSAKPQLSNEGFQIMVVDYESKKSLEYALRGVDVVISTVPGPVQIRIIDAAIKAGVKRFAPAEFEGRPSKRADDNSINRSLDRGKTAVLRHLRSNQQKIESTVFVCGLLYERFAPGGLQQNRMGTSTGVSQEGNFMIDVRNMRAHVPWRNASEQEVSMCLTAASDVGRFVTKALDIRQPWPPELIMHGERVTSYELLSMAARARGKSFEEDNVRYHDSPSLRNYLSNYSANSNSTEAKQIRELIATQEGRYEYSSSNLNKAFQDFQPIRFENWLRQAWSS